MSAQLFRDMAALTLILSASAQAHDPCDHQGKTTIVFPPGAADLFADGRGKTNARAIDGVASAWRTRHSILAVQGHEDGQEAMHDPDLAARRAAAVAAALVQQGVGRHWIHVGRNNYSGAPEAVIAAPDAGLGCLDVPGRNTAQ